jgi:hypothetical protein
MKNCPVGHELFDEAGQMDMATLSLLTILSTHLKTDLWKASTSISLAICPV